MLFSIRVLEFWVMEITNIYDFLHLLSLIKINPNMDFGGGFGISTYMSQYFFFFPPQRQWEGSQANIELRGKKHIMASIHLFVSFSFFKLGFN
jgi:hypothetical protein